MPEIQLWVLLRVTFTRRPHAPVLTKQNGAHLQRQMAGELHGSCDRFRRRSFVSSWHLWESSRRRHVQVGIREGLGPTEAGLMEHKMGSCGDVLWSAASGRGAALLCSAPVPISSHLQSRFRQQLAASSCLSEPTVLTRLFLLQFGDTLYRIHFIFICV